MIEYRWEFEDIGQGHYYLDLEECLRDAYFASKRRPLSIVKIEQFKPKRRLISKIKDGSDINTEMIMSMFKKTIRNVLGQ